MRKPSGHDAHGREALGAPHLILEARLQPVVADYDGRAERTAVRACDERGRETDLNGRPVPRDHFREEVHDRVLPIQLAPHHFLLTAGSLSIRTEHRADPPADCLRRGVAEEPLGAVVSDWYDSRRGEPDDALGRR